MTSDGNRLERALALHLRHQRDGGDFAALLREHPDLADLLQAFGDEAEPPAGPPAAPPAAPGTAPPRELGDYRLEGEIGRGGNGIVYAAVDRRLGRKVAIKLLHDAAAAQPTAVARLLREAQLLARLDHPGIVKVHDVGHHAGRTWLAMERVTGGSLAARLDALRAAGGHSGSSLRELVAVAAQVAAAVAHAHAAGILHRDVKPANVLLRDDGSAVLTDFGIARDAADPALTQTGAVVGSPHYMAPEQVLGGAPEPRTDVFALGAVLYECIALQRAFAGPDTAAVLRAVLYSDPPDPRRRQRGVPADLVAIVQKALEKDPAHRYASAAAFAADLRAFLELREVAARSTTRLTRWLRRARRQPAIGAMALAAAALLLLLGWLLLQVPDVLAARAASRRLAYDDATTTGFLARSRGGTAGSEDFRRALVIDPGRPEAVLGLVFVAHRTGGAAAALAELDRHAGVARAADAAQALQRCRAWLLRALQRPAEAAALEAALPPPRTSLDLWLQSLLLTTDPTPAALAEARSLLSLAVRTAPQPQLLLHVQWTKLVVRAGQPEERREAAEALLRQWPEHPVALHLAGVALLQQDPPRARDLLQDALRRGETDPLAPVNLGIAEALAGDVAAGVATLRRAFAAPALEPAQRVQVLQVLGQLQATADGDELAEQWLATAPDDAEALRFGGRAAWRRGDHAAARARFERAIAARPDDPELQLDLVLVLRQAGDRPAEQRQLAALAARHPDHERVHRQFADVLLAAQDRPALLEELRRWTRQRPAEATAWRELAARLVAGAAAAEWREGLAAAEQADYLAQGQDRAALELRAAALEQLGERGEAERLRRRAAALGATAAPAPAEAGR